jgi:NDP-sugar pyrophosphorylase family protein
VSHDRIVSVRQALILAGGAGTRLRSVVSDRPKPMAEVGGRPFIEYLLAQVANAGIEEAILLVGYKWETFERHLGDGDRLGIRVRYSREDVPLGTGGALKKAEALLTGDRWLVLNGDSLFDISIPALIDRHIRAHAVATLALARVADSARYGSVTLAVDGSVTAFVEKSDSTATKYINGGLYMIERSVVHQIPADRPVSFEREVLPELVGRGLHAEPFDGYFIDIGVPEDFARANADAAFLERLISDSR